MGRKRQRRLNVRRQPPDSANAENMQNGLWEPLGLLSPAFIAHKCTKETRVTW